MVIPNTAEQETCTTQNLWLHTAQAYEQNQRVKQRGAEWKLSSKGTDTQLNGAVVLCKKTARKTDLFVGFPEWTAQFSVWKTTGKDSSEACPNACQNCVVYSVFPSGMTSHSKITQFNWGYRALKEEHTSLPTLGWSPERTRSPQDAYCGNFVLGIFFSVEMLRFSQTAASNRNITLRTV
jgi:hypothetical protein